MSIKCHLIKEVSDQYGRTSEYHLLDAGKHIVDKETGDLSFPKLKILLYDSEAACVAGNKATDCFRPALPYVLTEAERTAETGSCITEKDAKAFLRKITTSILVDGVETNIFRGVSSDNFDYIGCEV